MYETAPQTALRIMRQVFDAEITHHDITQMDHHSHRAYAAIAWILLDPQGRLDENLYFLGSFHRVMSEVTGRDESRASDYTTAAGITTSDNYKKPGVPSVVVPATKLTSPMTYQLTLCRVVRITPPPGLRPPSCDPIVTQLVEAIRVADSSDAVERACARLDAYLG